jgi:bacteriorhodopsin
MASISLGEYNLIYNAFSLTIAVMGASTIFFLLGRSQVTKSYRTAVTVTALVTLVACYHYFRIFDSWVAAYTVIDGIVKPTGVAFNDAYRYVDWLLTVPLLLLELILVMKLPQKQTVSTAVRLGLLAVAMVALGYPGEVSTDVTTRWIFWVLAMIPFTVIVVELFVGLKKSIATQPENVRSMVSTARWITVLSWCFYPLVFVFPMIGFTGGTALALVQVGYTVADIVAKAAFGIFIYTIAVRKSEDESAAVARTPITAAA